MAGCFKLEKLEEYISVPYISRSYKIASNNADKTDLSAKPNKYFLRISLCHSMKSFSEKINKSFNKGERNFIKFVMSLLANSGNHGDIFEIVRNFFVLLLSKTSNKCEEEKQLFVLLLSKTSNKCEEEKLFVLLLSKTSNKCEEEKQLFCSSSFEDK